MQAVSDERGFSMSRVLDDGGFRTVNVAAAMVASVDGMEICKVGDLVGKSADWRWRGLGQDPDFRVAVLELPLVDSFRQCRFGRPDDRALNELHHVASAGRSRRTHMRPSRWRRVSERRSRRGSCKR